MPVPPDMHATCVCCLGIWGGLRYEGCLVGVLILRGSEYLGIYTRGPSYRAPPISCFYQMLPAHALESFGVARTVK